MVLRRKHMGWIAGICLLTACGETSTRTHGPIVLGDSTAIVTETDPQKLKDLVADLQPTITPTTNKEEETRPAQNTDTAKPVAAPPEKTPAQPEQPASNTPGLKAAFRDVTVMIPGLVVKQSGNPNLERANGAVYTLTDGDVNGATLRISGGTITKVSQRYQSVAVLKTDMGILPLEALSNTTDWEQIKGNGAYRISGLDARSLEAPDADAGDIRSAVQRAAQRRRMSRKKVQELVNSIRHVRSADQKPLSLMLRSVMWKIDGKDAQGRAFSKQIRIDIPM